MQWWMLLITFFVYCVCAYLSYSEEMRGKWWFVPVAVALGTVVSTIWFLTVRYLGDKQKIYVFSLFWDFVMMFVYYFLPVVWFGVKMDKWSLGGMVLMVTGLLIIKLRAT